MEERTSLLANGGKSPEECRSILSDSGGFVWESLGISEEEQKERRGSFELHGETVT